MRTRLALIPALALMAALIVPTSARADGPRQSVSRLSTLIAHSALKDIVYGVSSSADGIAGPGGAENGFTNDADGDGSYKHGTTDTADGDDESETTPPADDGRYGNTPAAGLGASTGDAQITEQTLLQIIIGIIFGQDRPWEEKRQAKEG